MREAIHWFLSIFLQGLNLHTYKLQSVTYGCFSWDKEHFAHDQIIFLIVMYVQVSTKIHTSEKLP